MMGFRFSLAPFLALMVFVICGGVVWFAHIEAGEMTVDRRPPLVKAAATPLKRSPDDPGGRAVADLGGVGDLLREQPAETEEQLLPRPEQPVPPADRSDAAAGQTAVRAGVEAQAALEALVSEIRGTQSDEGDVGAGGPTPDDPVNAPGSSQARSAAGDASPSTNASSPPPAAPSGDTEVAIASPVFEASAEGRYRVQLAAVRAEADAERAWDVFQQQLGPFITGLRPFFERAETSNGVFYRVQVGPFAETGEADRLCSELKKQEVSCFVVSR